MNMHTYPTAEVTWEDHNIIREIDFYGNGNICLGIRRWWLKCTGKVRRCWMRWKEKNELVNVLLLLLCFLFPSSSSTTILGSRSRPGLVWSGVDRWVMRWRLKTFPIFIQQHSIPLLSIARHPFCVWRLAGIRLKVKVSDPVELSRVFTGPDRSKGKDELSLVELSWLQ